MTTPSLDADAGPRNPVSRSVEWLVGSPARAFFVLLLVGLALRLSLLPFFPKGAIPPNPNWETGAVAISLARTGAFSDPYLIPTGPTAHVPPLYVGAMSLVYRALGVGFAGGLARWILVFVAYSVLWASLPWIGGRLGIGPEAGFLGGAAGVVALGFPGELEPYSALALMVLMAVFVARWSRTPTSPRGAFLVGLGAGVAFHLQPALLPVVVAWMGFELLWSRERRRIALTGVMILGIVLACLPWGWRNYRTFHKVIFIRGNLGLELHVGNHAGADADIAVSAARSSFRHPRLDLEEAERVREVGEAVYMGEKLREALAWIADNPGAFLRLTVMRIVYFWIGPPNRPLILLGHLVLLLLAAVGGWHVLPTLRAPERAAVLLPLATYPLVYYVIAYMPRYGEPVRWILFLLAGAAVWRWISGGQTRYRTD
jgi:hypothetical protein